MCIRDRIRVYYDGSSKFTTTGSISLNTWTHVAVVRSSGTITVYFNGTADGTTQSYSGQYGKTGDLYIGDQHTGGGGAPQMYVDDLRVTKGVARYTSNFTAPTAAHLTSAGDSLKNIIVNEDADGVIIGTGGISTTRIAKAWADIDGSAAAASQIESSYNISSMTDHGSAQFSFNFSTAMTDADYSVVGSVGLDGGGATSVAVVLIKDKTTALVKVHTRYVNASGTSTDYDYDIVCIQVFGN